MRALVRLAGIIVLAVFVCACGNGGGGGGVGNAPPALTLAPLNSIAIYPGSIVNATVYVGETRSVSSCEHNFGPAANWNNLSPTAKFPVVPTGTQASFLLQGAPNLAVGSYNIVVNGLAGSKLCSQELTDSFHLHRRGGDYGSRVDNQSNSEAPT